LLADGNIHGPVADRRNVFKAGGAGTNQRMPRLPRCGTEPGHSRAELGEEWEHSARVCTSL
jgi:hypothetical protein